MKKSAGLLMFRRTNEYAEVLLGHGGGPWYEFKNVWSIPKGEINLEEDEFSAAIREFMEETGITPEIKLTFDLGLSNTKSGKINHIWAFEGNWNPEDGFLSNKCEIEYPPHSGVIIEVPEIDMLEWFNLNEAKTIIMESQKVFIERLMEVLKGKNNE
jgi:predicted NUDIX family NTP pyrophosphohydrolase